MGDLYDQLAAVLPDGMSVPGPLALLFEWIEERGYYSDDGPDGKRVGFLYPPPGQHDTRLGTCIEFFAEGFPRHYYFGANTPSAPGRLCVFASSGADGSMAALWLDDDGATRIVHLGSGSGSTLICVLAENAVDFLRLCAIGYDEICWGEELLAPPRRESDRHARPNTPFRDWVAATFSATIPATGATIVRHPDAKMQDDDSKDRFWRWCMRE